jgi:flagellar biosynthesis protein FlhB
LAEDSAERTEPATPKRREEARERGEVAMSRDATAVAGMAVAFALLTGSLGTALAASIAELARLLWSGSAIHPHELGDFHALILASGRHIGGATLGLLGFLCLAAAFSGLLQIGPLLSPKALELKWERMDPLQGLKRMLSPARLVELAKAFAKLGVVGSVAWWVGRDAVAATIGLFGADPLATLPVAMKLCRDLVVPLLTALAVLAVADILWTRFQHDKKLRMSRQDVRQEALDRDGNPQMRARMRQSARELSRQRLVAEVGKADVVLRNPTHYAVALAYERSSMGAPRVLAKGRNAMALLIVEIARRAEVPIVEDPPLARMLYRTAKVGREIPVALFQAIAEVLAHVYRLDRRRGVGWGVTP